MFHRVHRFLNNSRGALMSYIDMRSASQSHMKFHWGSDIRIGAYVPNILIKTLHNYAFFPNKCLLHASQNVWMFIIEQQINFYWHRRKQKVRIRERIRDERFGLMGIENGRLWAWRREKCKQWADGWMGRRGSNICWRYSDDGRLKYLWLHGGWQDQSASYDSLRNWPDSSQRGAARSPLLWLAGLFKRSHKKLSVVRGVPETHAGQDSAGIHAAHCDEIIVYLLAVKLQ